MTLSRRQFLTSAAALGVVGLPGIVTAEDWPSKPIRIISPYPPGGIVDILARLVGDKLSQSLKQPVLVESKAGAGGNIGTAYVARSRGDPYTLLLGASGPLAINVSLYKNIGYDVATDFTPISLLAATPLVLVTSADSGIKTVSELLSRIKSSGAQAFYGSAGAGTPQHLAGELFKQKTATATTHVAYKGGAPAVVAVLGSEVLYAFENLALVDAHIKSGRMIPLAVTTAKRTALLPSVPTMMESGIADFEARGWYGLLAPAGLPDAVIKRLSEETMKAGRMPDVRAKIAAFGSDDVINTPDEFRKLIAAETVKWRGIVEAGKITVEG
ncbi:Bug family tripartite tricarboxylate transporter substrate binding protein [Herbaspirillum sp. GCM10030257]|uniref:Bug family tripartite tricarboxylate transporter substrate binding protein n=1 Tax=Herbaspirillum sp. GCM10030257 TaxID=3273393 RepID=UPI003615DEED